MGLLWHISCPSPMSVDCLPTGRLFLFLRHKLGGVALRMTEHYSVYTRRLLALAVSRNQLYVLRKLDETEKLVIAPISVSMGTLIKHFTSSVISSHYLPEHNSSAT